MIKRNGIGLAWTLVTAIQVSTVTAQGTGEKAPPKATVALVSSVEAVVAGRPFDVGLQFKLPEEWHIYWQNSGDSGQAPRPTWSLPTGFTAGPLRFPVPVRHVSGPSDLPIITNILAGEPVLLARITPPQSIAETKVTLAVKLRYLRCREVCVIENESLSLELSVLSAGSEPKAADESLFRQAQRALPQTSSEQLAVMARTEPATLTPGQPFELVVDVGIKPGFHVQSNKPTKDFLIPTELFLERVEGVLYRNPVYPPGQVRSVPVLGKVSEYAGKLTLRVPANLDAVAAGPPAALAGLLKYQACTEKGNCLAPTAIAFSTNPAATDAIKVGSADRASDEPTRVAINAPAETGDLPDKGSPASIDAAGAIDTPARRNEETPGAPADTGLSSSSPSTAGDLNNADDLTQFLGRFGTIGLLFGCFIYGLFINATPCVLPLLSIKVLGFVQQARESRRRTFGLALAFGAGVVIFFIVLGLLAAQGKNVLQYPAAVIALGAIVTALALSMLGVYTLQVPTAATKLDAAIQQEGMASSFGKGALAPVLGFACTGPLMAAAFGWATKQPVELAVLAFVFMGLGMASPYVLLGANPNWLSFLPRPGQWMITFERIMGFLLLGMVIWMIHPLVAHLGPEGLEWTLVFLVAVSFAFWLLGKVSFTMSAGQRWRYRSGAGAIIAAAGFLIYGWIFPLDQTHVRKMAVQATAPGDWSKGIPWQAWSPEGVQAAVQAGHPVFVDFTAAYCTACKTNKALAINKQEVFDKMRSCGMVAFQGDFTQGDERIFHLLQRYERPGVPLNLIYPAGRPDAAVVLRPALTKSYLLDKLDEVCADRTASALAP